MTRTRTFPTTVDTEKLIEEIEEQYPELIAMDNGREARTALFTIHKNDTGVFVDGLPESADLEKLVKDAEKRKTKKEKDKDARRILAEKIKQAMPEFTTDELKTMFPNLSED